MSKIIKLKAKEVLDSRGFPTVEVELTAELEEKRATAMAIAPSGASTGEAEALELRDQDVTRFLGKGVKKAVENVNKLIASHILNQDFAYGSLLDDRLNSLDGTANKSKLGANAILPISMAFARAHAELQGKTLCSSLKEVFSSSHMSLPVPLMNIINGGKHADNHLDIQEFMIIPFGFNVFNEALRAGVEIFHHLKKILHKKGLSTAVGDEGGFAPLFKSSSVHEEALDFIMEAIVQAGYQPGSQIALGLDCAASEFFQQGSYLFEGKKHSPEAMIQLYQKWIKKYPIVSIEDGFSEHDWSTWSMATQELGHSCQLVGDDLFVTNTQYLQKGIEKKCANAILIKLNQIGTVTETLETMKLAKQAGMNSIISHRSGETEDTFIADLAVATNAGQIKTGSASRTDRIAKYNQLLRLESALALEYAGKKPFEKYLSR